MRFVRRSSKLANFCETCQTWQICIFLGKKKWLQRISSLQNLGPSWARPDCTSRQALTAKHERTHYCASQPQTCLCSKHLGCRSVVLSLWILKVTSSITLEAIETRALKPFLRLKLKSSKLNHNPILHSALTSRHIWQYSLSESPTKNHRHRHHDINKNLRRRIGAGRKNSLVI